MLSLHDALPIFRQSVPSTEAVRALDDTDVETGIKPDATHARRLIQGDEAPDLLLLRAIVDPLPRFGCVVTAVEPVTQHPDVEPVGLSTIDRQRFGGRAAQSLFFGRPACSSVDALDDADPVAGGIHLLRIFVVDCDCREDRTSTRQ